ncbi:Uma2 family endonuclease [Kitasatospora viridis]|uniref:Uma2 family endonuclease n=1 Tax=Kitasatospora viridis TaxID=281105 RepID=A0A561UL57_9ACTN|nr:Uma2 family endonuclease [Kitasatospora viridis]TWG00101.1 Uma2 family endonuclease [Kitasatospora viridis]
MSRLFENWEPPEGVKAELLRGEIVLVGGQDVVHNLAVTEVQNGIPDARWHRVTTQDVLIPSDGSEPQPDLVVCDRGAVAGAGRAVPASAVTLVVEVVSRSSVDRDYRTKRHLYAEGGIPAYLIVDPLRGGCVLLSEPRTDAPGGEPDYLLERSAGFGDPLPVDVLGLILDTSEFQTYS